MIADKRLFAACMNEWMRRYIEDPHAFAAEFETVRQFAADVACGDEPSYGDTCLAYLEKIAGEIVDPSNLSAVTADLGQIASGSTGTEAPRVPMFSLFWRGVIGVANALLLAAGARGA